MSLICKGFYFKNGVDILQKKKELLVVRNELERCRRKTKRQVLKCFSKQIERTKHVNREGIVFLHLKRTKRVKRSRCSTDAIKSTVCLNIWYVDRKKERKTVLKKLQSRRRRRAAPFFSPFIPPGHSDLQSFFSWCLIFTLVFLFLMFIFILLLLLILIFKSFCYWVCYCR